MNMDSGREWPWSALEIAPTQNEQDIKAAYARILKRDKPQSDPEKFQALKEARDFAISISQGASTVDNAFPAYGVNDLPDHILEEDPAFRTGPTQVEVNSPLPVYETEMHQRHQQIPKLPPEVMEKLELFLANPWARQNIQGWQSLFNELPLLTNEQNFALECRVALALDNWMDGVNNFPSPDLLEYLFEKFDWNNLDTSLDYALDVLHIKRITTLMTTYRMLSGQMR